MKTKSDSYFSKASKDSGILEYKNLLIIVTNALKNKTEIFSWETTPNLQIADAILTSMSIPGFFYVRYIDNEKSKIDWNPTREKITSHKIIPYVDGGVLNNYPINIFHDYKYWLPEYYALVKSHHFNPSSLGIRVDSKEEVLDLIDIRHHKIISLQQIAESEEFAMGPRVSFMPSPSNWFINPDKIFNMTNKFVTLLTSDLNKVEQYCQRTIAIYDCDIQTTQFNLTETDKIRLKESGKASVNGFFEEYFKNDSFKKFHYSNRRELEEDIQAKNELIQILSNLKHKHTHEREITRLKLEIKLEKEKSLALDKKSALKFFKSSDVSTSAIKKRVVYSKTITDEIEENPSIGTSSTPEASAKQNKIIMPLKLDDNAEKNSPQSGWCCWR